MVVSPVVSLDYSPLRPGTQNSFANGARIISSVETITAVAVSDREAKRRCDNFEHLCERQKIQERETDDLKRF